MSILFLGSQAEKLALFRSELSSVHQVCQQTCVFFFFVTKVPGFIFVHEKDSCCGYGMAVLSRKAFYTPICVGGFSSHGASE